VGVFDLSVLKEGIPDEAFKAVTGDDKAVAREIKKQNKKEREHRQLGEFDVAMSVLTSSRQQVNAIADDRPEDIRRKREIFTAYQQEGTAWCKDKTACDLWTAAFFVGLTKENVQKRMIPTTNTVREYISGGVTADNPQVKTARGLANDYRFFHWPLEFPEVFGKGGFDCVLGNPPFMGGLKISGNLGNKYRNYLGVIYAPFLGKSDLCAIFHRRSFESIKISGNYALISTNTISQGDTRESGIKFILKNNGVIIFVHKFVKWEGSANVEVNLITVFKGKWPYNRYLDGLKVDFISSRLDTDLEMDPQVLKQNEGMVGQGSVVLGTGFILSCSEANDLIHKNPKNADCIFPFINGDDLNNDPKQYPSRKIINFFDWSLEKAKNYPDLIAIVTSRVKPDREKVKREAYKKYWWQYGETRPRMYKTISSLDRILVRAQVSDRHMLVFIPTGWVYSHKIIIFPFDDYYHFSLLQSNIHEIWVKKYTSTLRTDVSYIPSNCFETFPFPQNPLKDNIENVTKFGFDYYEHRRLIMLNRQLGLTKIYNLFNNPENIDPDIIRFRKLHREMDNSVLLCYGWPDIKLKHDFFQNERGQTRFTIDPSSKEEILRRLLELNLKI